MYIDKKLIFHKEAFRSSLSGVEFYNPLCKQI